MTEMNIELVGHTPCAPSYAHPGDAGMDLYAARDAVVTGETVLIPTGVAVAVPDGHVGLVCPRSGLSKHGVTVANAPGVVDAGYRGEVMVRLTTTSTTPYQVHRGDRIAQLLIVPIFRPEVTVVDRLDNTERGAGGFGSTGR